MPNSTLIIVDRSTSYSSQTSSQFAAVWACTARYPGRMVSTISVFIMVMSIASGCFASEGSTNDTASSLSHDIDSKPGMQIRMTRSGGTNNAGKFVIHIPKSYDGRTPFPLVVSSHGAGANGEKEYGSGWGPLSEQHGVIVVCPSYASAVATTTSDVQKGIQDDHRMLRDILSMVARSLRIDASKVMHTGYSGGGVPTYFVAMLMPRAFTAICLRSSNYYGNAYFDIGLAAADVNFSPFNAYKGQKYTKTRLADVIGAWKNRPICTFWGRNDHPIIIQKNFEGKPEGPEGLEFLTTEVGCTRIHHFIHNGGHDSHPEWAAEWFARYAWFAANDRKHHL
jgi:hypothetical protein